MPFPRWEAKLQALDLGADYELHSWDDTRNGGNTRRMSGKALTADGFALPIAKKPGAALFTYRRIDLTEKTATCKRTD